MNGLEEVLQIWVGIGISLVLVISNFLKFLGFFFEVLLIYKKFNSFMTEVPIIL